MKRIIVNKDFLSNYQSFLICFDNVDVYEIPIENILDVSFEAELLRKGEYYAANGYVKISSVASNSIKLGIEKELLGTDSDHRLKKRLGMTCGAADVVSFCLKNENKEITIYLPYNPLTSVFDGLEIEYSNCPSFETDADENMLICFGENSKMPKRKDNNYDELVLGWREFYGNYEPQLLKVKAEKLEIFGEEEINVALLFKIDDRKLRNKYGKLVFANCKDISVDMYLFGKFSADIYMTKMTNGQIYVAFDGLGIDFNCSSVKEYRYDMG